MFSPVALYVVGIMSGVVSVAVLGSLLRSNVPGLSRWILASIVIVVALTLLAVDGNVPMPLTIATASSLFAGSGFLVLQGCRLFFGLPPMRRSEAVGYAIVLVGVAYWTLIAPNGNARITLLAVFLVYVRLMVGWTVFTMRPPHRPAYSYRFVSVVAVLGGLVHIARGLANGLGLEHHTQFLEPTPINIVFLGLGIVTLPCLSIGAVMLAYDRMAERMEKLATIDELTGALVRREFMVQAELHLARASRGKARFSVAILDIDNFKAVNDAHGHAAGDRALCYFSSTVAREIRGGDIFGRLGGEEFAVLFPATSGADAIKLVNRLRMQVAASTLVVPRGQVSCTFSAGVEEYQTDETLANLMARADSALYLAKAMGRNRVVSAVLTESATAG
jgi:diguanylate cyclase (GGDEF)-like protein